MRNALVGIVLAAAIACGSPARAADVAAGKEKAELCVACHGEGGISQIENTPSLAPPKPPADDNPDLSKKGAQAAAGRRCASCHTDSYAGTKAVARVAGQRQDYLLKALRDYKSGVRSGGGQAAMAEVAFPLHEEEIVALAHYLANLK